ncbi:unnamed protein product [Moneuplotes crassus]|uniref:Uncharacterized protein n=1 Tax=Euplotes crassus TaxID=5936 RepID=A0AAD1UF36_EUPCR|nr:unnamed protein product [Moneuplotes crassus]
MSEKEVLIEMEEKSRDGRDGKRTSGVRNVSKSLEGGEPIGYSEAFYDIVKASIPSILTCMVYRTVSVLNFIVIGRLGDPAYVSGAGLGIITYTIACTAISRGLGGGIDTLCSQAFGNKNPYLAGCYYHRAVIITSLLMIPQGIVLWNCEAILVYFGLPELSAKYAAIYIRILLPSLWCECQRDLLRKFLSCQKEFKLILYSQIISSVLHPLWLFLTIYVCGLRFEGVAIANSLVVFSNFFIPFMIIYFDRSWVQEESWHWFSKDSFNGLWQYLHYGFPSLLVVSFELWGFEGINIMAGYLGVNEMGACSIVFEIIILFFMLALGMSFPSSSLVGNSLGAGKPKNALIYAMVAVGVSLALGALTFLVIFIFPEQLAWMFTNNEVISRLVIISVPLMALCCLGDFAQCISAAIIRAMGKQKYLSISVIISYWLIVLPLTYYCAFTLGWGITGIMCGLPIGLTVLCLFSMYIIFSEDFSQLSQEIIDRIQKDKSKIKQTPNSSN